MLRRFRRRTEPAEPTVDRELESLDATVRKAEPGLEAELANRAGDLCLQVGQRGRALRYFGRAIDANLKAGRVDAAGAICRKVLRVKPDVVRAHCTLAWLVIGKQHVHDARREIDLYVSAGMAAGQAPLMRVQLREMARVSEKLREHLADCLREVGDDEGAREVRSWVDDPDAAPAPPDSEDRWAAVVRAALQGPDELLLGTDSVQPKDTPARS
jgi:hypothetical protein